MKYSHQEIFKTVVGEPLPYDCGIARLKVDYDILSRHHFKPNAVSYYSYTLIENGTVEIELDHAELKLHEGDMFICPPGVDFKVKNTSKDYEAISILAEETFTLGVSEVKNVIRAAYTPLMLKKGAITSLSEDETALIRRRMEEIGKYYYSASNPYRMEALRMLYGLMIVDILNIQNELWIDRRDFTEHTENMLVEFIRLLHANFRDHPDIPFYADALAVTPIYLSRIVKKLTGRTVMSFVNEMRLMEASNMLAHTNHSIALIAESLNFANPASFCKFFVRHTGVSPREYRQKCNDSKLSMSAKTF